MTTNPKPTLLLSQRYTSDSSALWRIAVAECWRTERIHGYRAPDWLLGKDVAIYGENIFASTIASQLELALIEPTLDWLVSIPKAYLHRQVDFTQWDEIRNLDFPQFIKPAEGKLFEAKVYNNDTELPTIDTYDENTPVLVSEPVEWEIEFRCFIANRELVTFSTYSYQGEATCNQDGDWYTIESEMDSAMVFCQKVLQDAQVEMPPVFVMDIGRIKNRGWAIIEANPIWASGIYSCDPAKILPLLRQACLKQHEVTDNHRQWIIERLES